MKGCVLAGMICVALVQSLKAQENQAVAEKVAPVARQLVDLQERLSKKKSLSVFAIASGRVEPGFGRDDAPNFTATFKLFYQGKRFLYDVEFIDSKGPTYSQVNSFDGERYSLLNRKGEVLSISSKGFNHIVMCDWHVLFMPFQFLQSAVRMHPLAQLSYEHWINKDDWRNALASIPATSAVEEMEVEGQQCLKVSGIGKHIEDPIASRECVFDVYFAKKADWYPMRWERRSVATGELVTSYAVEELGFIEAEGGERIPYPRKSAVKKYKENKLRDTSRLEVLQIGFDSVSDEDLTIDPSSVSYIRDVDKGTRIKISR